MPSRACKYTSLLWPDNHRLWPDRWLDVAGWLARWMDCWMDGEIEASSRHQQTQSTLPGVVVVAVAITVATTDANQQTTVWSPSGRLVVSLGAVWWRQQPSIWAHFVSLCVCAHRRGCFLFPFKRLGPKQQAGRAVTKRSDLKGAGQIGSDRTDAKHGLQ